MAVYTPLTHAEISDFLADYEVGELVDFKGIAEGVSNTNYLIKTQKDEIFTQYILTIFEKNDDYKSLSYCLGLMEHLSSAGITCPSPMADKNGNVIKSIKNKPAVIVSFLDRWHLNPKFEGFHNEWMSETLGDLCAKLHIYAHDYTDKRENPVSLEKWKEIKSRIGSKLNTIEPNLEKLVSDELKYIEENWIFDLPSGAIHADLFPDNVALVRDEVEGGHGGERALKGVIDFYYACDDAWMYDVAICINAWCFNANTFELNEIFLKSFLNAYINERSNLGFSVSDAEKSALPILTRVASMRFLVTRADAWLNRSEGALVNVKDPMEYVKKLRFWQNYEWQI